MYRKVSILTVVVIAAITLFMGWRASQIEFDYNFETFFPKDDPATLKFLEHREQFITDNDYVLIGIRNEQGIFQEDFLSQISELTKRLEEQTWAEYVISPTNISFPVKDPFFGVLNDIPYLHFDNPLKYKTDSARIYSSPELAGNYFSEDGKAILIYLRHKAKLPENGCRILAANTNEILLDFDFDEVHFAGRCDAQVYYIGLMQKELLIFVGASILLIVLFLSLSYRSLCGLEPAKPAFTIRRFRSNCRGELLHDVALQTAGRIKSRSRKGGHKHAHQGHGHSRRDTEGFHEIC